MFESVVRSWWVFVMRGVLAVLFGIAAFAWPHGTLIALVTLFGAFALVDGIVNLGAAPVFEIRRCRWWLALDGLLGIAVGALTFLYPGATTLALVALLGLWLLAAGVFRVVLAVELRRHLQNEWLIVLGGALTVIAGALLLVWPGPSALALVWVIGVYAILYGGVMVAAGHKLHQLATHLPRTIAASR